MTVSDLEDVLAPALLARTVFFTESPHGLGPSTNRTYTDYASVGIYINDLKESQGIPIVSPLVMRVAFKMAGLEFARSRLAAPILGILAEDEHMESSNLRFDKGQRYEHFHAHWEHLWRQLHLRDGR
jgi:hypothetical protein